MRISHFRSLFPLRIILVIKMIIKICILMTVILILLRKIWNLTRNCKVLRIFLTDYLHQICWIITSICSMSHESRLANRCKYFLRAYSMIHFFHKHYNLKMMKGFVKIFLKYKRIKIKFSKSILTFFLSKIYHLTYFFNIWWLRFLINYFKSGQS